LYYNNNYIIIIIIPNNQAVIRNMELDETYKYLGIEEGEGVKNSQIKDSVMREYYHRVQQILKTEPNSMKKITAVNTLAVPVLVYSLGIVNWLEKK